jgi:hypothetical protein
MGFKVMWLRVRFRAMPRERSWTTGSVWERSFPKASSTGRVKGSLASWLVEVEETWER